MFSQEELNKLFRYSLALSKKEEDAYDILQQTLEKMTKGNHFSGAQFPFRYTMRSIKNTFIDLKRRERPQPTYDDSELLEEVSLDLSLDSKIDIEIILKSCSEEEREILYLWAYEGMSYSEIGTFLEVSKGTLLSKIHRLKARLKENFSEEIL